MSAPVRFGVERPGGGRWFTLAAGLALAGLVAMLAIEALPARVLLGLGTAAAAGLAYWLRLPTALSVGDGWLAWRIGSAGDRVALSAIDRAMVWRERPSLGVSGVAILLRDGSERELGRAAPSDGRETEAFIAALESYAVPVLWVGPRPAMRRRRASP